MLRRRPEGRLIMRLSIRNRFDANVESVSAGPAMTVVRAQVADGLDFSAVITSDAAADLKLEPGSRVQLLIKSTEVSLALDLMGRLSIRNVIPATVSSIDVGTAMTVVKLGLANGGVMMSAITRDSAEDLGLEVGMPVVALVKSTDVAIAAI